jgi:small subunit ribosomal protein S1
MRSVAPILQRAQYDDACVGDAEKIKDADGVVTGSGSPRPWGGLIVDIGLSWIPSRPRSSSCAVFVTSRHTFGQEIEAKILEPRQEPQQRRNVSPCASSEQTQSESRTIFLNNPRQRPGSQGRCIVDFIGPLVRSSTRRGVDGLVHVSELSWKHIEHASVRSSR